MGNLLVWNIQQLSAPKIERQQFGEYLAGLVGGAFNALLILELTRDKSKAKDVVEWFRSLCVEQFGSTWQVAMSTSSADGRRGDRCALLCTPDFLTDIKNQKEMEGGDMFGDYRRPAVFEGKRGSDPVYIVGFHAPSPQHKIGARQDAINKLAKLPVVLNENVIVAGDFNVDYAPTKYDALLKMGFRNTRIQPEHGTTLKLSVPSWSTIYTTSHAYDQIFVRTDSTSFGRAKSRVLVPLISRLIGQSFAIEPEDDSLDTQYFEYRDIVRDGPADAEEDDGAGGSGVIDIDEDDDEIPLREPQTIETPNDAVWFFRHYVSDHLPVLFSEDGFDTEEIAGRQSADIEVLQQELSKKRRRTADHVLDNPSDESSLNVLSTVATSDFVSGRDLPLPEFITRRAAATVQEQTPATIALMRLTSPNIERLSEQGLSDVYIDEVLRIQQQLSRQLQREVQASPLLDVIQSSDGSAAVTLRSRGQKRGRGD